MIDLRLGDCLDVLAGIPDGSVDMVLADLPYAQTDNPWDSVIPLGPLWAHYKRVCKPDAAIVLTASQPFTSELVMSNRPWFRCEWIWQKNRGSNFGNVRWQPMKEHESVLVFARKTPTYNPQMQTRAPGGAARTKYAHNPSTITTNYGFKGRARDPLTELRVPSSVQEFTCDVGLHPTQKPVALFAYLIRTYSNPGDLVLDNAMGSGTTGAACLLEGRSFVGIERDPAYFAICERRLADAQHPLIATTA